MNTHLILPLLVIGALTTSSISSPPNMDPRATGPVIRFDTTLHDFGTIPYGGDGHCTFRFTNTGDAPLIIESVKSSCGCLVPSWDRDPVLPGGRGNIRLRYDTRRIGPFTKSVTLTSNAVNTPTLVLRIKGSVAMDTTQRSPR